MKVNLNVKGMHCKSCEVLVSDSLLDLNGVDEVEVSAKKNQIIVEFDDSIVQLDKIKQTIVQEGFEVL